jgi:tetratricopeptide (TPR) repeat protein
MRNTSLRGYFDLQARLRARRFSEGYMKSCAIWLTVTAALLCMPLHAQNEEPECNRAPSFNPEYRLPGETHCVSEFPRRPSVGLISARSLAHQPSKAARKEVGWAFDAHRKGREDQEIHHLEEAVRLDPNYLEALAELGADYAMANRPGEALESYDRALGLDPNWAMLHSNKAAALVMLSRFAEAERTARKALQLDSSLVQAHYMLGFAMLMQGEITPEAAEHLAVASARYDRAKGALRQVESELARTKNR